ncbi:MAG: DNA polymerase III subunit alpha, partial [Candidatus Promineifilaceae bacterium]|nr:DNA polymerase III subunit alpha [Candidatus Promineifilaceae bacterium]
EPHDVLLCIQTGKPVSARDRMRMSDHGYYLKSHQEMAALFGDVPGALENSLLIAEMCDVNPEPEGYHLPHFEVPAGHTPASYLRQLCEAGLAWRYGEQRAQNDPTLKQRLDHELNIIHSMGFDTYFLIVWDLCEFARERDIWWNVRGSGAGSLVAYTLGITGIDPLDNGLIFERFLNPGRVSMPDIDLDYPDDRRHEMIEYTIHKYGSDKVAQIITFGTMGARAAIRDVGRVLDVSLADVDEVAKLIPAIPGKPVSIDNALEQGHEFFSSDLARRYRESDEVRALVDTARNLEGVARHASTHAAGVIIADKPLVEYAPLHRPTSGGGNGDGIGVVTQWPMEILDSIGLLKVDFLGLSTLTVLRKAAVLIEQRHGVTYTMENIPYDVDHVGPDPSKKPEALFDMLGRGEVAGVFQVEGAGMRRLMLRMRPSRFDHIIAAISLYRPGPMDNIPEYVARMHGEKEVSYHHPDLEPILHDTYGILVYQEQIIRIAADMAGYAPGEADLIRKAVAKKKGDLMEKHRAQFIEGAMARGYSRETCEAVWGDIEFFARYGFNKAHAADYAVITCQTAFLKAHYPVEYMAALLSVERNNTDKVATYLAEARRLNITVAPPQINQAQLDFSIEGNEGEPIIRYGMGAIKNAGVGAIEVVLEARDDGGPFSDLADFCERVDLRRVGKRALESMIKVGVFDEWGSRPQLLDGLDRIIAHSGAQHDAAAAGQMSLFGGDLGVELDVNVELLRPERDLPENERREILGWEKELIGVYLSEHPLSRYVHLIQDTGGITTADLDTAYNGRTVAVLGLLSYLRKHVTKKGDPMAFGNLEDLHGSVELLFFPRTWKEVRAIVEEERVYLVRGTIKVEGDERIKLIVEGIENNLTMAKAAEMPQDDELLPPPELPAEPDEEDDEDELEAEPDVPAEPTSLATARAESEDSSPQEAGAVLQNMPPPPPNFEEEDEAWLRPAAEAPSRRANMRQRSNSAGNKPSGPLTGGRQGSKQGRQPEAPEAGQATVGPGSIDGTDEGGAKTTAPDAADHEGQQAMTPVVAERRMVVVEVAAEDDWRAACREVVAISRDHEGADGLRIQIAGQKLAMDFPNLETHFCEDLVEAIQNLPAVRRVDVVYSAL